jgi:hypothetical protein
MNIIKRFFCKKEQVPSEDKKKFDKNWEDFLKTQSRMRKIEARFYKLNHDNKVIEKQLVIK